MKKFVVGKIYADDNFKVKILKRAPKGQPSRVLEDDNVESNDEFDSVPSYIRTNPRTGVEYVIASDGHTEITANDEYNEVDYEKIFLEKTRRRYPSWGNIAFR